MTQTFQNKIIVFVFDFVFWKWLDRVVRILFWPFNVNVSSQGHIRFVKSHWLRGNRHQQTSWSIMMVSCASLLFSELMIPCSFLETICNNSNPRDAVILSPSMPVSPRGILSVKPVQVNYLFLSVPHSWNDARPRITFSHTLTQTHRWSVSPGRLNCTHSSSCCH